MIACRSSATKETSTINDSANVTDTDKKEAKEERNKRIVKASSEAFCALDVYAVAKDVDPTSIDFSDGLNPPVKGVNNFKDNSGQFFNALADMKGENLTYVAHGDWVVVWAIGTGL